MRSQPRDPFFALAQSADDQIDLARGALLVAQGEYPDLDPERYLEQLDRMAADLQPRCAVACTPMDNLELLNDYLFAERGFRANGADYADARNSCLNQVMERRIGIPITLGVVYLEIGRRLGLPLSGVDFPENFLIRYQLPEPVYIDLCCAGRLVGSPDLPQLRQPPLPQDDGFRRRSITHVGTRQILAHLLRNLRDIHLRQGDDAAAIRAAERITWLLPDDPEAFRALGHLYSRTRALQRALAAFDSYLRWAGEAPDAAQVRERMDVISAQLGTLN